LSLRRGLPALRADWIQQRDVHQAERTRAPAHDVEMPLGLRRPTLRGGSAVTQMTYARSGEVTPEMEFERNRKAIDSIRKQKGHKLGWRFFEARRLYGVEVAERMFPKRVLTPWQQNTVNSKRKSSKSTVATQG